VNCSILHIGYHKTASTWFQTRLYPRVTSHRFVERKKVQEAFFSHGAFGFDPDIARVTLGGASDLPLIVCEELLSGSIFTSGLFGFRSKEAAHQLKSVFPDGRVVIFIRNQVEMVCSAYNEYVKMGGTYSPRRFLYPDRDLAKIEFLPNDLPRFTFEQFCYSPLVRHYRNLFGAEDVYVFPFEAFRRDPKTFIAKFAETLELTFDEGADISLRPTNLSYRPSVLAVTRFLNLFTRRTRPFKVDLFSVPFIYRGGKKILKAWNRFLHARGATASPQQILGEELVEEIRNYYRKDNSVLRQEFGICIDGFGYPT
jgi:hypothetical protein